MKQINKDMEAPMTGATESIKKEAASYLTENTVTTRCSINNEGLFLVKKEFYQGEKPYVIIDSISHASNEYYLLFKAG